MKKKKRINLINILLVAMLLVGLSLLLYPTVSDYWNSFHQTQAITNYGDTVASMNEEEQEQIWQAAVEYNQALADTGIYYNLTEEQQKEYEEQLDISGLGIMGYIEIPAIDCKLPIYHGTDESVLQIAVGHLEWSSLPVGGKGSHCVLSGHRGLPSAKLFTDLDQLEEGDTFTLQVLGELLTYQVDQIRIVEPKELDNLQIEPGEDYCTLVTCTPYGINSHRLLVRGSRVENTQQEGSNRLTADASQIEPMNVAMVLVIPVLLLLLVILLVPKQPKKKLGGEVHEKKEK